MSLLIPMLNDPAPLLPLYQIGLLRQTGLLRRLARDRSGNTLAIVAAAIAPILAMAGGAIDMGRGYMAQSRLQGACDAGVLAARKVLAATPAGSGIPAAVSDAGNSFFNINFRTGSFSAQNRTFNMTLESDNAISGDATADVPATIMRVFGFQSLSVVAHCQARLNFSNSDIMMVLDTTGSMADTNPGDSKPKIDILRDTVQSFYNTMESTKAAGTRIRYGFVPYSTNVNVGGLLQSGWVVDNWAYQGRVVDDSGATTSNTYNTQYTAPTGSATAITPYSSPSCPASTVIWVETAHSVDPDGTEHGTEQGNGDDITCVASGAGVTVSGTSYSNYIYSYTRVITGTTTTHDYKWDYKPVTLDVSVLKGAANTDPLVGGSLTVPMNDFPNGSFPNFNANFRGCMEERDTYEITDYNNVDLNRAMDLDLDRVPTPGDPRTQWRPMLHEIAFDRGIFGDGSGNFSPAEITDANWYLNAGFAGYSACPAPAQKLQEMTSGQVTSYLGTLSPNGSTYHDIGMIWGARLLSSTGLFAADNADQAGKPTSRNLIFLTDGLTDTLDLSYGAYGIEPLDQRRWNPGSGLSLTQTVENRFKLACTEAQKRNIKIWVIGFGTALNPALTSCAGSGHSFQANNAAELSDIFTQIAGSLAGLRISK